jgi:dolichol-phosphate mannosyltransferase
MIPTYNERENIARMCDELLALGVGADLLFVDDGSPDGTGQLLDDQARKHPGVRVMHRAGKSGIGSAHQAGISAAYEGGYRTLVTMDCDFTHAPSDVPRMMTAALESDADVVIGSRYLAPDSLPGWNLLRRSLTTFGHFMTRNFLEMPEDASGALRLYRLDRVPRTIFGLVQSRSYSFFFESLFLLSRNGYRISEIPIVLPARTYGHSKMSWRDAFRSLRTLLSMSWQSVREPQRFIVPRPSPAVDAALRDPQGWDDYWTRSQRVTNSVYSAVAEVYRRAVIKRNLERAILREFPAGARLLHAGCGGGQVDAYLQRVMRITALDISPRALELYVRNNPGVHEVRHGSILELPFPDASFDGVYNLGVVEHFEGEQLDLIFREIHRVLVPGGRAVIFWPHTRATSAFVLDTAHALMRTVGSSTVLHPREVTRVQTRGHAASLVGRAGLRLARYEFGARDFWVQAVVVAEKPA